MTTMNLKPTDDDPAVDNPSVEWNDDMVLQWANAVIYKSWSSPLGRHIFVELEKMLGPESWELLSCARQAS